MYTQWERMKPLGVDGFPVHFFSPCPLEFLSHSPSKWCHTPFTNENHTFFFAHCLCRIFFFSGEPLCTNFYFQTKYRFFLTVKSWFIIYVFVLYKLFYTHNRSKDTGHFNVKSFRKCTHSERGWSHLEWTASLCIFSVPVLWNSSPTAHQNDAILHSPMKTILCGS